MPPLNPATRVAELSTFTFRRTVPRGAQRLMDTRRRERWRVYGALVTATPVAVVALYFVTTRGLSPSLAHASVAGALLVAATIIAVLGVIVGSVSRFGAGSPTVAATGWAMAALAAIALLCTFAIDDTALVLHERWQPSTTGLDPFVSIAIDACLALTIVALFVQGARVGRGLSRIEATCRSLAHRLTEARRQHADAELRALKAELNPHFLGNALDGVRSLLGTDVAAADAAVSSLAELLRRTLRRATAQEATLREEIDGLAPFVDVARARLNGELDVRFDVDGAVLDALVPDLILQCVIDDALRRGMIGRGDAIVVAARPSATRSGCLDLSVSYGVAMSATHAGYATPPEDAGPELSNVAARLKELYGPRAELSIARGEAARLVRIIIPWRDGGDGGDGAAADALEPGGERGTASAASTAAAPASGFGRHLAPVASFTGLWLYWFADDLSGTSDVRVTGGAWHSAADGIVVATLVLVMVHLAFWLSRRVPLHRDSEALWRTVARTTLASIVVGALYAIILCGIRAAAAAAFQLAPPLDVVQLAAALPSGVLHIDIAFLGLCLIAQCDDAILSSHALRRHRRQLSDALWRTRRRRTDAELRALSAELNPHFIGNALHGVSALVRTDPSAAARAVEQLSAMLHLAANPDAAAEVTLREELDSIEPFLAIARLRMGADLDVRVDVADEATLHARVPHLILQPLVENAVKHGFAGRGAGRIDVRAWRRAGHLEIAVSDDGAGVAASSSGELRREGVGLRNVRARLVRLYGSSARLDLSSPPPGGFVARLLIPQRYRFAPLDVMRPRASAADAAENP